MKKERIFNLALILLPVVAVGIACTPNSILLYDAEKDAAAYTTFLALLPEGTLRIAPVLALLLSSISAGFAISFVLGRKQGFLKAIQVLSFLAVTAAVVPILMQTQVRVLPNMWVPLLMAGQWILTAVYRAGEEKNKSPRKL